MLRAVGIALWGVVLAYVTLSRFVTRLRLFGHEIGLPGLRMALMQVLLATCDVAITASIFYTLLPATHRPDAMLTFPIFLGIYVTSYTAGIARQPAGRHRRVRHRDPVRRWSPTCRAPTILGAIVVFRLYYYIIPLFLAGTLFAGNELLLRGSALLRSPVAARGALALARWNEPDFAVAAATGAVVLSGVMLLGLGVVAPRPDFSWLDPDFADFATQAGQFIPSLIGASLVVLAIGLSHRVNLAWGATILLLVIGAAFAAAQGDAAVDRRRAGPDNPAARPVPRQLLPPRPPARRPAGTVHRALPAVPGGLPAGADQPAPARAHAAQQRLVERRDCRPTCPTRCASVSRRRWRWRCSPSGG